MVLGPMRGDAAGNYTAKFSDIANPSNITVGSNLVGNDTARVKGQQAATVHAGYACLSSAFATSLQSACREGCKLPPARHRSIHWHLAESLCRRLGQVTGNLTTGREATRRRYCRMAKCPSPVAMAGVITVLLLACAFRLASICSVVKYLGHFSLFVREILRCIQAFAPRAGRKPLLPDRKKLKKQASWPASSLPHRN